MGNLSIETTDGGVLFTVKVVPGSSRTSVSGLLDDMLKVKVSAAAENGKANKCLIDFLSQELGVKKNVIRIISGQTNPVKRVEVFGVSADMLEKKLGL